MVTRVAPPRGRWRWRGVLFRVLAVGVGNEEAREFEAAGVPKSERGGRLLRPKGE